MIAHLNAAGESALSTDAARVMAAMCVEGATATPQDLEDRYGAQARSAYSAIGQLLDCEPTQVALCGGASDAFHRLLLSCPIKKGDHVLTTSAEFIGNWLMLRRFADRFGIDIDVVQLTGAIQADVRALEEAMRPRTRLVSLTHIASDCGNLVDVAALTKVANRGGAFVTVDAAQSIGHVPINFRELGCDALLGTSRKFLRGPAGIGFFALNSRALQWQPLLLDGRGVRTWRNLETPELKATASRFESRGRPLLLQVGLAAAVQSVLGIGVHAVHEHVRTLTAELSEQLSFMPDVTVHEAAPVETGILTFSVRGWDPVDVADRLRSDGVIVWPSPSGLRQVDSEYERVVRASTHVYNDHDDIDRTIASLRRLLDQ